jgi:ketosteroid isomerase-like protein
MSQHELVNIIAAGDAAINAENFDAVVTFYADEATLVIERGRCVTGHTAIRNAFVAIAEHFNHTLHVSQEEVLVLEGAGTALVLANTRVRATLKSGEPYDVLRRATYVFRREGRGRGAAPSTLVRHGAALVGCGLSAVRGSAHNLCRHARSLCAG